MRLWIDISDTLAHDFHIQTLNTPVLTLLRNALAQTGC